MDRALRDPQLEHLWVVEACAHRGALGSTIQWSEVLERWKGRGEMNKDYVATIQRGYRSMHGHAPR